TETEPTQLLIKALGTQASEMATRVGDYDFRLDVDVGPKDFRFDPTLLVSDSSLLKSFYHVIKSKWKPICELQTAAFTGDELLP
ncbi:hypothetical protein AMECASPLE_007102, partial [Ameca splendens]